MSAIYDTEATSEKTTNFSQLVSDSHFETFYDSITKLIATQCECPIAMLTFVDDKFIWIQSEVGFPNPTVIPNTQRFCGYFPKELNFFEIENTDADDTHYDHMIKIDGIQAKSYAGARIKLPLGELIGILCVFDVVPRKLNKKQRELLIGMADVIEKSVVARSFQKFIK